MSQANVSEKSVNTYIEHQEYLPREELRPVVILYPLHDKPRSNFEQSHKTKHCTDIPW